MTKVVTITDRARLSQAASLEDYYRLRAETLMQYGLDLEAELATVRADRAADVEQHLRALDEQEARFLEQIAGLEDELRVARGVAATAGEPTDGE